MKIEIGIENPHEETRIAISLIKKLMKINNINRVLKIAYDHTCDEGGYHYPLINKDTIYINPDNCKKMSDYDDDDSTKDNLYYPGYTNDNTIFGVVLHEFSHFLCYQVYKTLADDYKKEFPNKRLYLNWYSNTEIDEEIANIIMVYISNPYLLKLISEKHYKFLKRYFKSPVACSVKRLYEVYAKYPIHIKNDLKNRWGIIYNHDKNIFEKGEVLSVVKEHNEV